MMKKTANSSVQIDHLLAERWSPRAFDPDHAIEDEKITALIEAAHGTQYETGAASENICLQATSMGLFAHRMGGFDAERTREVFKFPQDITPIAVIAVGYYGDTSKLDADFVESEQAERERKPLQKNFFKGDFDTPYGS